MHKLWTIISAEYRLEVRSKSFWLTTLLFPVFIIGLGGLVAYLSAESDAMKAAGEMAPHANEMTGIQALGMMGGMFLTLFVIMYGSMIFNKVKAEKTNRIVEVLVSCVSGRSLMFAKVISVAFVGLTQIFVWSLFIVGGVIALLLLAPGDFDMAAIWDIRVLKALLFSLLFFAGGFSFYGALFAVAGALTDRNNENQGYLSILMMLLMVSFYLGMFAVDNTGALATFCFYLPFTSPTVATVQTISAVPWYYGMLSLIILYASAAVTLIFAGKVYTSAILLNGKKLYPRDIIVFLKAK